MGFYVIKGTFHIKGYSPDGDSIRFKADNTANWSLLDGPLAKKNGSDHVQLRLEAIDTLETHYGNFHQPLNLAFAAMDFLLQGLGITNVQWNAAHSKVIEANDAKRGYIIARTVEKNQRPISFAFAGEPNEADWSPIFFRATRLRESLNYKSVEAGMAYPTYYQGLFPDLRKALTQAATTARAANRGVWEVDKTEAGFGVQGLASIEDDHVILPKLFRRLAGYLEGGGSVAGFKEHLASLNEGVTIISNAHFTHFDTVVDVQGNVVKMNQKPENLIFAEG